MRVLVEDAALVDVSLREVGHTGGGGVRPRGGRGEDEASKLRRRHHDEDDGTRTRRRVVRRQGQKVLRGEELTAHREHVQGQSGGGGHVQGHGAGNHGHVRG